MRLGRVLVGCDGPCDVELPCMMCRIRKIRREEDETIMGALRELRGLYDRRWAALKESEAK